MEVLQSAWPLVESSYLHHEAATTSQAGETLRGPLAKLMERTREKIRPLLQQSQHTNQELFDVPEAAQLTPPSASTTVSSDVLMDPFLSSALSPATSNALFGNVDLSSMHLFPQQLSPSSLLPESQIDMACGFPGMSAAPSLPSQMDPSWSVWDDFLSGISIDESQIPMDTAFGAY